MRRSRAMAGVLNSLFQLCHENPRTSLLLALGTLVFSYYFREVVKQPLLACKHGGFQSFLLKHCPIMSERFWPAFLFFESRVQTVLATFVRCYLPSIEYKREIVSLSDGGEVCLDWVENDSSCYKDIATRPTVLFLPGLTGDSDANYIKSLILQASKLGYRSIVFNNRGRGGIKLKTPRTYCACNCEDLKEVVNYIKKKYPNSPLIATGISLGGIILTHYLVQMGAQCPIAAALLISVVWDVFKGTESLERPFLNLMLNRHLAFCLVRGIKDYQTLFQSEKNVDMEKILKSTTIKQFDTEFTSKVFGFNDIDDYYSKACLNDKIGNIKVPVLCLNAADDPFQPFSALPLKEVKKSNYVALLITSRGGHIGFLEGLFPVRANYIDRLFSEYSEAVFKYSDDLQKLILL